MHFCTFCVYRLGNSSSTDNTNTKQESSSTTETGSADELNKKRDDLYQQENQLFADHKDAWDKAFGLMNKNAAGDAMSENYADSLASTVESNKDSFSEEEYETLCKDIETIRGIEEELPSLRRRLLHPIPLTALPPNQTNPQLYSKVSKEKIWMETM